MTMKEELAALKEQLAGLKERITKDDAEAIAEGEKLKAQIEEKEAAVKAAEKKAALLNMIGNKDQEDDSMEEKKAKNIGEHLAEAVKAANIGKRFQVAAAPFKAAADTIMSPADAVGFSTHFDRNVVTEARVPLNVRALFGQEHIEGSTLTYLVEGAVEGDPAVTAEGAKKPQVHFADPEPKTVSLKKVAAFIKESDEYINDYKFMSSAVNGRLMYRLGLVEQNMLVTDLLATSGLQTGTYATDAAVDIADAVLKAAMDAQDGSGFAADAVLINPVDWYKLRIGKNGENNYYGGGYFGAQSLPNIWGLNVCVSTAVTAGTIIVGGFKACASVVNRDGINVEATNSNEDDFVKNLMTIRAEERLVLAVRRPAGFVKLTKA